MLNINQLNSLCKRYASISKKNAIKRKMLEKKKKTKYEPAQTIRISKFRKLDSNVTLYIILCLIKQKNLF